MNAPFKGIPVEQILSMQRGAKGYRGKATAFHIGGVEVIVMARDVEKLKAVYEHLKLEAPFREDKVKSVAIVSQSAITFDDEL